MILAIVQARLSSSRLPGKVLRPIMGRAMILYELERLSRSRRIDNIVLATSEDESDDPLAETVRDAGFTVFRGNLGDVLGRYDACAKAFGAAHVVRITGDCPLIDPAIVDAVIDRHLSEGNDYTSNTLGEATYPDGLDTEVMRYAALERAYREARLPSEREHVTQYIIKHPELFKQGGLRYAGESLGRLRWTVDEPEDFLFVESVYERLYLERKDFAMRDILDLLEKQPDLTHLNEGFTRNEGMKKSLEEDKLWKGEVSSCRKSEKEV
ncbi:cytidylyltransferase domain-containing protein [Selenomonas sp. F0473]|uniref:cytidylyltransferase domain-containing protein n=1 Tax=Selenomonas sp. F0473 TaxID=999423 RepID=UPI00029E8BC0|nr:glycosyltransferase family protein [Selenomonas sp. F0473]EKU70828.1 hypothetical protein HMPREF9161_01377 [Selenomonas sp. F0473]